MIQRLLIILLVTSLYACSNEEKSKKELKGPLFQLLTPEKTSIHFSNELTEDNVNNNFKYEYFYNGGGVAIGDINNDGLSDIYFTGNQVNDKIYLNKGGMVFEDITEKAITTGNEGWHTGVTMADMNGDGWLDIYVCRAGNTDNPQLTSNLLYINNGDLTFSEQAATYGLGDKLLSTQASFFDYDLDGDLDVYVVNIPRELFNFTKEQYFKLLKNK